MFLVLAAQPPLGAQRGPQDPRPAPEDCLVYNPNTLKIIPEKGNTWVLTDGYEAMVLLGNEQDATNALAVAQRHSVHCFIGRHARTRAKRGPDYLIHYWKGSTGKTTSVSPETCTSYTPSRLTVAARGSDGWSVSDGTAFTLTLDNQSDALAALALARQYSTRCTIGQDDFRPPSLSVTRAERIDYWK